MNSNASVEHFVKSKVIVRVDRNYIATKHLDVEDERLGVSVRAALSNECAVPSSVEEQPAKTSAIIAAMTPTPSSFFIVSPASVASTAAIPTSVLQIMPDRVFHPH
ncbi:MAG: hypothetical protein QM809_00700 [Gordonia sp. (in: high G+C Gram-positive bacteria)]|uniref:hypothetical protein n=1 Tax=Gordonia sp. (in: high G+C Gram-positive bacteria) TaxID=84139 RepID=UPI0039E26813